MDDTPFAQSASKILGRKWGAKITPLYRKRERLKRCVRDGGTSVVLRLVVKKVTFRIRQTSPRVGQAAKIHVCRRFFFA